MNPGWTSKVGISVLSVPLGRERKGEGKFEMLFTWQNDDSSQRQNPLWITGLQINLNDTNSQYFVLK